MVSTVSESAIKNPDFVSEKQQDVRAAEAVRRVQQRRRHDAPAAQGQRAVRDPHRPPGKWSTFPSLISICVSVLQFSATVEHSVPFHINLQFCSGQNGFQMGNDCPRHLSPNLHLIFKLKCQNENQDPKWDC